MEWGCNFPVPEDMLIAMIWFHCLQIWWHISRSSLVLLKDQMNMLWSKRKWNLAIEVSLVSFYMCSLLCMLVSAMQFSSSQGSLHCPIWITMWLLKCLPIPTKTQVRRSDLLANKTSCFSTVSSSFWDIDTGSTASSFSSVCLVWSYWFCWCHIVCYQYQNTPVS